MRVRTQIIPDPSNEAFRWTLYYCSDQCVEQAHEATDIRYSIAIVDTHCDYCERPIKEA